MKNETIRIDNNTVADVDFVFDLALGEYKETNRSTRTDVLVQKQSLEEQVTMLKEQNAEILLALVSNNLI